MQVKLLKHSFLHVNITPPVDTSTSCALMWQMYLGIVVVDSDAWLQFKTECDYSLSNFKTYLQSLYRYQCLIEGRSKEVHAIPYFKNNTILFFYTEYTLLPYHIATLCLFVSKSLEQWKYYSFQTASLDDVGMEILSMFLLTNKENLTCIESFEAYMCLLTSVSSLYVCNIIQEGLLIELNLTYNRLCDSGAHGISKAIEANSTLRILFLHTMQ